MNLSGRERVNFAAACAGSATYSGLYVRHILGPVCAPLRALNADRALHGNVLHALRRLERHQDGGTARLDRLLEIDFARHARKAPLQVAERVGADTLDRRLRLQVAGEIVAQRTGAGKLKVPVHEMTLMMSMALRFIPTLIEETDKIMSAQKARGADFETGSLIQRAKALLPILVPLFVSSFRRADELAVAMESRCYHGGEGRTRMNELHYATNDYVALFLGILLLAAVNVMKAFGL